MQLFDFTQLAQQLRQLALAVEVDAVAARVLRDDDQLLHAVLSQHSRLIEAVVHRAAAVAAPQRRDDAVGAVVVAALGDLQVGVVVRCGQDAAGFAHRRVDVSEFADGLAAQQPLHNRDNIVIAARAEHAVYLRHFAQDFVLIAL